MPSAAVGMPTPPARWMPDGMPSAAVGMPSAAHPSHLSSHSQHYDEEAALAAALAASQQQERLESMRRQEPEPELEPTPVHSQGAMSFNKESIMAQLHEALTLQALAETKKDKEAVKKNIDRLKAELAQIQSNERMLTPSHSPPGLDYSTMIWVDAQNPDAVAKLSSYKNVLEINKLLHTTVGYTRDVKKAIMKHLRFILSYQLFETNTGNRKSLFN